ncbi:hypothetical protein GCM10022197_40850 [Microlunatus spumicola]|uniref:DUF4082 domain-containing protein n=1 Tax=Microlunatus spumicola TaxID=81499 RepID=A0ABP6Y9Z9_9ACTN
MIIPTPSWRTADLSADRRPTVSRSRQAGFRALAFAALALLLGSMVALSPWTSQPAQAKTTVLGTATPAISSFDDDASLTVGVKFTPKASGAVTGVRFYKGSGNTGRHVGALYSSTGQLLRQASFDAETSGGWQSVTFDTPVAVRAGSTYTAATFLPDGHYALTSGWGWPDDGPDMVGLAGTYNYGRGLEFPASTYGRSNYFVDVTFQAGQPATAPQPAPTQPTTQPTTTPAPAPAPSNGFPDAGSTGVPTGVSLSAYTGPSTITRDGTVIDGKKITSCLVIKADDVTIKNSLLQSGQCFFNVLSDEGNTGLTLTDVEIDGQGNTGGDSAINGGGYTCLRCDIHGTVDGLKAQSGVVVRDSFIHDLAQSRDSHNDGIQTLGTTSLKILHNRIVIGGSATSAIILSTNAADQIRNVQIDGNLLGGGAYTVYGGYDSPSVAGKVSNIAITNNRFTTAIFAKSGAFGPLTSADSPVVVSGNTWYDGPNAGQTVR